MIKRFFEFGWNYLTELTISQPDQLFYFVEALIMGNLFCKQASTPATSDLSKAIDPTGTYFLQKHLTILVLFGLFTFGQYGKPPRTVFEDNKFENDVLLY